jgi:hypothetical protein
MLSERRDEDAATAFFKQAINNNGFPDKVVMDKSGSNYAGLANINLLLILAGFATLIDICQVKYLNNIIEQDHCPFKADHDFILCTLGNKGELSQNLPINATEPLAFILKESGARCNGENIYLVSIANSLF